jgi:hypothetical protein
MPKSSSSLTNAFAIFSILCFDAVSISSANGIGVTFIRTLITPGMQ